MAKWSYTQLSRYKLCPFQYKCERIDKLPAPPFNVKNKFIGVLLEQLVQQFYMGQWWHDPSTVVQQMRATVYPLAASITKQEGITWVGRELEHWTTIALDAITPILRVIRDEKLVSNRVVMEQELRVKIGGHEIHGRADFIIERPDRSLSAILDGKGGGTLGKGVHADQLRLYAIGTGQSPTFGNRLPERIGFWWYRHGKVIWRKVEPTIIDKFSKGVLATIGRVQAGQFPPKPGVHCKYCDFRAHCPEGREYLRVRAGCKTVYVTDQNAGSFSMDAL